MSMVIVDHLAFTFSASVARDFEQWFEFNKVSGYVGTLPKMPVPPAIVNYETGKSLSGIEYQQALEAYHEKSHLVIFERLSVFFDRVLGLYVGPIRSRGMHGYTYSCRLLSLDGASECGYLMFGGNNDTIHVQISGSGCRYVFADKSPSVVYNILKGLGVSVLSRVDLAFDDFIGLATCHYAELAYSDGAFRSAARGSVPSIDPRRPRRADGSLIGETIYVGSRQSRIYWRIYDKALEQKLFGVTWYRSEVELKRVSIDVLSDVTGYFMGICDYSSSIISGYSEELKKLPKEERDKKNSMLPCLRLLSRLRCTRRQVGSVVGDVLAVFEGDVGAAFGLLMNPADVARCRLDRYESQLKVGGVIFTQRFNC